MARHRGERLEVGAGGLWRLLEHLLAQQPQQLLQRSSRVDQTTQPVFDRFGLELTHLEEGGGLGTQVVRGDGGRGRGRRQAVEKRQR